MPEYRRIKIKGGTYFFTVITYHRRPVFSNEIARNLLHAAFDRVMKKHPFTLDAICLLPDHIHCIWTLPEGDDNFSVRWWAIKRGFSRTYMWQLKGLLKSDQNLPRKRRGELTIWQRRFWEHTIRDNEDFFRHLDYIHYNPVKHGLIENVIDWPWSSFHRYIRLGYYEAGWGANQMDDPGNFDFGE